MQQAKWRKIGFFFPLFFLAGFGLLSWVVQLLWNWIIASTFSLTPFSYGQAMGLLVLSRILFGGFKFGSPPRQGRYGKSDFKNHQKWMNMSDEERQQFKESWKERCTKRDIKKDGEV